MFKPTRLLLLALPLIAAAPLTAGAQQSVPLGPESAIQADIGPLISEMQEIQEKLRPMQEQALQDPALQSAGDSLSNVIRSAMSELDPQTESNIARLTELVSQAEAAQAAQDEARFNQIIREAGELDQRLQMAQAAATDRPDVSARLESFEARVQQKMKADNGEAEALLARLDELNAQLAAVLRPS